MNRQKDNDKLDDLIFRAVNTDKPQFDAEKWKQKYPDEYQALISRNNKTALPRKADTWKAIFTGLAAAAAVIIVLGVLFSGNGQKPDDPIPKPPFITDSPAKIISMASMRMAYQQGGMDALDKQLLEILDVYGPRSSRISIKELL